VSHHSYGKGIYLSVRHTSVLCQNDASQDHEIFTISSMKDSVSGSIKIFRKFNGVTLVEDVKWETGRGRILYVKFFNCSFSLCLLQVVNPFYVFQIFSVVLWCFDQYYIYAGCIVVISLISLSVELYETRKVRHIYGFIAIFMIWLNVQSNMFKSKIKWNFLKF